MWDVEMDAGQQKLCDIMSYKNQSWHDSCSASSINLLLLGCYKV